MIKFEEAVQSLSGENVVVVYYNKENDRYQSGLIRYDGMIPRDVIEVELGKSMELFPDICAQVKEGNYFQVSYSSHLAVYQVAIMEVVKKADYGSTDDYEVVGNLMIEDSNCSSALVELECRTKQYDSQQVKPIQKRLSWVLA